MSGDGGVLGTDDGQEMLPETALSVPLDRAGCGTCHAGDHRDSQSVPVTDGPGALTFQGRRPFSCPAGGRPRRGGWPQYPGPESNRPYVHRGPRCSPLSHRAYGSLARPLGRTGRRCCGNFRAAGLACRSCLTRNSPAGERSASPADRAGAPAEPPATPLDARGGSTRSPQIVRYGVLKQPRG